MYNLLHVKYPYSCHILETPELSRQVFEKIFKIKFHDNPCNGSRVVLCGLTDMTRLVVAFQNFANSPKKPKFVASIAKKRKSLTNESCVD